MRTARLDRRVRKEATSLVREARGALLHKKELKGKAGSLAPVTEAMASALADGDLQRVRHQLPVLDSLVDELIVRKAKSGMGERVESLIAAVALALLLRAFVVEAFKIPSSSMYPTLEIGDHIFVNKFIYGLRIPWTNTKFLTLREPKRGEVIVFKQPCEPERDYIKRVVATAGDTVEVRCNVLYVNGQLVPAHLIDGPCSYEDNFGGTWQTKTCSRYRETVDGDSYDTYHDDDRPLLAAAPQPRTDFPSLDTTSPPSCATDGATNRPAENQALGELVLTKASAAACEPQLHYVVPKGHVFAMGDNRANSNDSRFWGSVPLENVKGKALFIWLSYRDNLWGLGGYRWPRIGEFVD